MKILVIVSEAPPITSGVSRVIEEINDRLRAAGHVVDTVSTVEVPRLELGEVRLSSMAWKGAEQILRRAPGYDVVHIHGPAPTFSDAALLFASLARLKGGPPIVYTHHCDIALPGKERLCEPYNFGHRALARLADHVVVSTPSYARSFTKLFSGDKITAIPWGVDAQAQAPAKPAGGFNVLFVGQMRPYKGLDVLLRAFVGLRDAQLSIVGNGHRMDYYRALAEQIGLENAQFLGRASDELVAAAYSEAHVVVLPSLTRAEAFGLVLLEGMAAGCVPVASRLPGLTDVVGEAGRMFEPGDHVALRTILQSLQSDRATLERLSAAAARRACRFSWDTTAMAYEQLFFGLRHGIKQIGVNWFPRSEAVQGDQPSLGTLFDQATAEFQAARASLMLCVPRERSLVISAEKGLGGTLVGTKVSLDRSVAGWVASQKRPLLLDGRPAPLELRPYLRAPDIRSSLSAPLVRGDQVVGVLNLARYHDAPAYTSDDLTRLVARTAECAPTWNYPTETAAAA